MRDPEKFEALLESVLQGERVPPERWEAFRDQMAILITDLSGFTRITRELGIEGMVALLHGMRRVALPLLKKHGGELVKYQADDLFAAFPSPLAALRCAVALQEAFADPNLRLPAEVCLCMGIGYGPVLWWGPGDLYGEEVNLASKLGEDTAERNEILLTAAAAHAVRQAHAPSAFSEPRHLTVGDKVYDYFAYVGGCSQE